MLRLSNCNCMRNSYNPVEQVRTLVLKFQGLIQSIVVDINKRVSNFKQFVLLQISRTQFAQTAFSLLTLVCINYHCIPVKVVCQVDGNQHPSGGGVDTHVVGGVVEELGPSVTLDVV